MQKVKMAILTIVSVALMMTWVVPALADDLQKININTANIEELMSLDGIGQRYAERIVAFREKNGAFQQPEDLMKVKGIGQKLVDINIHRIIVKDE